ncbi:hypothetical protein HMPREF3024_21075 [Achromobacter xylosoxidans]|nr:hypothetical protein HMPREF3024_21075 [Achromobacter xylosoxidans]
MWVHEMDDIQHDIERMKKMVDLARQEIELAVMFHETWRPAAYDTDLHGRIGESYAGNAFLIIRMSLHRELLLALKRIQIRKPLTEEAAKQQVKDLAGFRLHPNPNVKCASAERNYMAPADQEESEEDEARPIPVNQDHARRVQSAYDGLLLVEQRVVQAEYPRRHEYDDLSAGQRMTAVCRLLGISPMYYKIALGTMREKVRREFK